MSNRGKTVQTAGSLRIDGLIHCVADRHVWPVEGESDNPVVGARCNCGEQEWEAAADSEPRAIHDVKEYLLADLAVFAINGPTVLIFRPRERISMDRMEQISRALNTFKDRTPQLDAVLVAHDLDIMAIGEAELAERGFVRLPSS